MKSKIFTRWYWQRVSSNLYWGIKNLITYRKTVWNSRPWSFDSNLRMFKLQLEQLLYTLNDSSESLDKSTDISRAIELLDNLLNSDYHVRVGGKTPEPILQYEKITGKLIDARSDEECKRDAELDLKAMNLKITEWNELWQIVKNGSYYKKGAFSWID